jgi:DNA-binding GntR family transcriptional regulator
MKRSQDSENLVDRVYSIILATLSDQVALTSEKLSVSGFAESLNVSRTPVNMALVRLECDGLVRRGSDGGWYTNPLSIEDINEIFDIKEALGPVFTSKSAQRITSEAIAELLSTVEIMERAAQANDLEQWLEADKRYHEILFEVVGNCRYRRIQEQLNSQIYKLRVGQMVIGDRMTISSRQHREMAEAVASKDPQLAAEVTLEHIHSLKASLLHLVENILIPIWGRQM